jgi:ATP-dependent DNA ligase
MNDNKALPEKFHFLKVKPADQTVLSIKNKIFQRKLDGTAGEVFINDEPRIFGRGVTEYGILSEYTARFPEIVRTLKRLEIPKKTDFVGELIVIDPKTGFESLNVIQIRSQRSFATENHVRFYPTILIILDVVEVGGKDVRLYKYFDRIDALKKSVVDWNIGEGRVIFIDSSYELDWNFIERNKLEGVVIRDLDATYGRGIWKLKRETTEDVFCMGEYNPSENLKGLFSSLICYQLDKDGKAIYVADVGGGFSDKERKEMQKLLDSGVMKKYPIVIEIKTNGRTSSMKFKSPIFKRIRYDKPWNECVIG